MRAFAAFNSAVSFFTRAWAGGIAGLTRRFAWLLAGRFLAAAVRLPERDRAAAAGCLEFCVRLGFPGTDTGHIDHDRINESAALATSPPLPIIRAFFLGFRPRFWTE
jgi:hypothetical protein